jgi:SAM-dependent methyltransferase
MNIGLLISKIGYLLRNEGVKGTLQRIFTVIRNIIRKEKRADAFDIKYGTDTAGIIPLWQLNIASKNAKLGGRYQPVREDEFRPVIKRLEVDPASYVFIDLGCGKARALIIAAQLGFAEVIGVEFARELADVAEKNLRILNIGNGTIIHGDAAEYNFPDSNFVLYMFNPFLAGVMSKVIQRLEEFCAKHPQRRIFVIYHYPLFADVIDRTPFLQRLGTVDGVTRDLIWKRKGS